MLYNLLQNWARNVHRLPPPPLKNITQADSQIRTFLFLLFFLTSGINSVAINVEKEVVVVYSPKRSETITMVSCIDILYKKILLMRNGINRSTGAIGCT